MLVDPALTLTFVSEVATLPVIVEPLSPNVMPLLLLNTSWLTLLFAPPADTCTPLISPAVLGTV